MTNMPEAKLAREAELCYCSVSMVTDFDCWHPDHDAVTVDSVIRVLLGNAQTARTLVTGLAGVITADPRATACPCRHALDQALDHRPRGTRPGGGGTPARRRRPRARRRDMIVGGVPLRPLAAVPGRDAVVVIDQRALPHRLQFERLASPQAVYTAIRDMWVRGAPLIGAVAAYGLALQARVDAGDDALEAAVAHLQSARPTAVNLDWALQRLRRHLLALPRTERPRAAWDEACAIAEEDVQVNAAIGRHGLRLLQAVAARKPGPVNVLTHCNAGWLATVDWGTATSPHLPGARRRAAGARVGRRDAAAQPGRQPHGLGTGRRPACRTR